MSTFTFSSNGDVVLCIPSHTSVTLQYTCSSPCVTMTKPPTTRQSCVHRGSDLDGARWGTPCKGARGTAGDRWRPSCTDTRVSRYRTQRQLEVPPARDYLSSVSARSSQHERRVGGYDDLAVARGRQRARSPALPSSASRVRRCNTGGSTMNSGKHSNGGKEVVKYIGDRPLHYDDDDNDTVMPADSISQVSSKYSQPPISSKSRYRWKGPGGYGRRRDDAHGHHLNLGQDRVSAYEGQRVYDGDRGCFIEERWPQRAQRSAGQSLQVRCNLE